jgi:tRNA (adenine57-N1/adenine58-N1)-methyltransferase
VVLYLDGRRRYLTRVKRGSTLHTHKGYLAHDDLIGKAFGSPIQSSLGARFVALKPTLRDYLRKLARRTQVMYPKDMALLLVYANIGPGARVVEAGTGSGALTSLLAFYVKPEGRVYSYETHGEFLETARRNLERTGLLEFVTLKEGDVTQGIEETQVDAVVLDLATPWLVVPYAFKALKPSGAFASFSPTIEQVVKTVEVLNHHGFVDLETVECMTRRYQVERGRTRPETLAVAHTGYLTFGRKAVSQHGE